MPGRPGPWLLAAAVLAAALFALLSLPPAPPPIARGSRAPAFELPSLTEGAAGSPLSLAQLRGGVVLVNFWATWCQPCEDEMPAMERLYRALAPGGFALVAISVDTEVEAVARFRDRLSLSFPILLDPERRVAGLYQAFRFPESLLIGRDGVVVERYIGARQWDAPLYEERIRRLLAGD